MPQMAPIMWDTLMAFSFAILLFMVTKIYFSLKYNNSGDKKEYFQKGATKNINWLW